MFFKKKYYFRKVVGRKTAVHVFSIKYNITLQKFKNNSCPLKSAFFLLQRKRFNIFMTRPELFQLFAQKLFQEILRLVIYRRQSLEKCIELRFTKIEANFHMVISHIDVENLKAAFKKSNRSFP